MKIEAKTRLMADILKPAEARATVTKVYKEFKANAPTLKIENLQVFAKGTEAVFRIDCDDRKEASESGRILFRFLKSKGFYSSYRNQAEKVVGTNLIKVFFFNLNPGGVSVVIRIYSNYVNPSERDREDGNSSAKEKKLKERLEKLRQQYDQVQRKWEQAGGPAHGPLADKEYKLRFQIEELEETFGE